MKRDEMWFLSVCQSANRHNAFVDMMKRRYLEEYPEHTTEYPYSRAVYDLFIKYKISIEEIIFDSHFPIYRKRTKNIFKRWVRAGWATKTFWRELTDAGLEVDTSGDYSEFIKVEFPDIQKLIAYSANRFEEIHNQILAISTTYPPLHRNCRCVVNIVGDTTFEQLPLVLDGILGVETITYDNPNFKIIDDILNGYKQILTPVITSIYLFKPDKPI